MYVMSESLVEYFKKSFAKVGCVLQNMNSETVEILSAIPDISVEGLDADGMVPTVYEIDRRKIGKNYCVGEEWYQIE